MAKNMTIRLCLQKLQSIAMTSADRAQLTGLVNDYGYLGAITYLQPLDHESSDRDQSLADKHRLILTSL